MTGDFGEKGTGEIVDTPEEDEETQREPKQHQHPSPAPEQQQQHPEDKEEHAADSGTEVALKEEDSGLIPRQETNLEDYMDNHPNGNSYAPKLAEFAGMTGMSWFQESLGQAGECQKDR